MALYHRWDVKNDFAYVLQFFSLISDGLGSVSCELSNSILHESLVSIQLIYLQYKGYCPCSAQVIDMTLKKSVKTYFMISYPINLPLCLII